MIDRSEVRAVSNTAVLVVAILIGTRGEAWAPGTLVGMGSPAARHPHPRITRTSVLIGPRDLDYVFEPSRLTVDVGTEVMWINRTAAPHTVTSMRVGAFDRTATPFHAMTLVFRKAGEFRYFCRYHPYMHGVIIVKP